LETIFHQQIAYLILTRILDKAINNNNKPNRQQPNYLQVEIYNLDHNKTSKEIH